MVGAAYYVGTTVDHNSLLDFLDEPDVVSLHPWFNLSDAPPLQRDIAMTQDKIMVVSSRLGGPVGLDAKAVMSGPHDRSWMFNRLNLDSLRPRGDERLVDSNLSPVLLWEPSRPRETALGVSRIGTQADSPEAVSPEYAKWVRRTASWVSRRGSKVWGVDQRETRPDLDIDLGFLNGVYALPDALCALESGVSLR